MAAAKAADPAPAAPVADIEAFLFCNSSALFMTSRHAAPSRFLATLKQQLTFISSFPGIA
jgi:hypothetical protein